MTEKTTEVSEEDGSTKNVTVLAAIDSQQFADKVTYTNNNPYPPSAPADRGADIHRQRGHARRMAEGG